MLSRSIINLKYREAKNFFLDEKNYINFDLPDYFNFTDLLIEIDKGLKGRNLKDVCNRRNDSKPDWPGDYEDVNYTFLTHKSNAYDWRPLQLIHPVLYVDLVNIVCQKDNWLEIIDRFLDFKSSLVECISIPRVSNGKRSHKSMQVINWWERVEQKSIELSLEYDYIFKTDISNFYPSIYTHALDWALNKKGKAGAKKNRKGNQVVTLGCEIDQRLRNMNNAQTNGIPQGSTLMDFLAEILLGYADIELTNKLLQKNIGRKEFRIIRYRDDYRVFVNNPVIGNEVLKCISEVLFSLGLKMNPQKTQKGGDIITSSIKSEKLERIFIAPKEAYYQKEALRIYQLAKKYPNAGIINKELSIYFDKIENKKKLKGVNIPVLTSIFSMIAFVSPSASGWVAAIISNILETLGSSDQKESLVKCIGDKFKRLPNTSFVDVWLQRISSPLGVDIKYNDKLTKVAIEEIDNLSLWESKWLNKDIAKILKENKISNLKKRLKEKLLPFAMLRSEVELFKLNYGE